MCKLTVHDRGRVASVEQRVGQHGTALRAASHPDAINIRHPYHVIYDFLSSSAAWLRFAAQVVPSASMPPTPYYPPGLELEGYHDPVISRETINLVFFSVAAVVILAAWSFAAKLPTPERTMAVWLVVSGLIHLIVEGTFILNPKFYQNSDDRMLLLEMWKEYSHADSRYALGDGFTTTMEAVTAFGVGPACLVAAHALYHKIAWRWVLVIVLSTMQIYGTILYFAIFVFDGGIYLVPSALNLWLYFVGMNSIWLVMPGWCICYAVRACLAATAAMEADKKRQ